MTRGKGSIFRPKYAPDGMTWAEAKAVGALRESEVWWCRYRLNGRTQRESTGTTRHEEARRFLHKRLGAIARSEPVRPKADRATFAEMATALRRDYELNKQDSDTLEARLVHLEPFFGAVRMAQIVADDIERYKTERLAAKAANGTINRELGVLARAFTLGRKLGRLTAVFPVRDYWLTESPPRSGFFERDQFEAVRAALPPHLRPVAQFGYETGWRLNEVVSRQWQHVDLEAGTVRLEPGETKTDEPRVAYCTPELLATLRAQRAAVETLQRTRGRIVPWVFFRQDGRPVKSFRKAWNTACEAAEVQGRIFHDFRRTAARDLVRRGVPERVAMDVTGHRTRAIFDRYNIVSEQDRREAAMKMAGRVRETVAELPTSKVSSKVQRMPARSTLTAVR